MSSTESEIRRVRDNEVEKPESADLGDFLQARLDLGLPGVLQTGLESFQDGFLLVLTSADDEWEAELISIPLNDGGT